MKRFRVTATVTISVQTIVEALNAPNAIEKSRERPMGSFVRGAFCDDLEDAWIAEELDGEPQPLEAVEEG